MLKTNIAIATWVFLLGGEILASHVSSQGKGRGLEKSVTKTVPVSPATPEKKLGTFQDRKLFPLIKNSPNCDGGKGYSTESRYMCANYANGLRAWLRANGIRAWYLAFGCHEKDSVHAATLLETDPREDVRKHRFCIVEPQVVNRVIENDEVDPVVVCWEQSSLVPRISPAVDQALKTWYNWYGSCVAAGNGRQPEILTEPGPGRIRR